MSERKSNSPAKDAPDVEGAEGGEDRKEMPEGVRVKRKRRKKRGGSRQTLFQKKREILREMHADTGAVGVKEQVERLKTARKAKENNQPLEEQWGGAGTRHRGARWALLRLFAIIIPVLAIVTAFLLTRARDGSGSVAYDPALVLDRDPEESPPLFDPTGPIAWINDNPHETYRSAIAILDQLNETGATGGPLKLFRNEEVALARIAKHGLGWESEFFTADPRELVWSTGESGATGFMVVEGRRKNHEKFRSYFVRTPSGLRLDWEASAGWCELPFERVLSDPPAEPFLVRGIMMKEAHFDMNSGPGSLYSWYLIRNPDESRHLWAYAPVGSSLDRKLLDLFRFGWVILDRLESVRVTVRLSKPKHGFRDNEYAIEELITEEWVIPNEKERAPELEELSGRERAGE